MSGILDHVWGVSAAQDRIWAQVNGIAPSKAGRRLLMIFQTAIDESTRENGNCFVLGGYVASAERWAGFTKEWEEMLPFGTRKDDGTFHFKMSEMAQNPVRMNRVPGFYRIIEKYAQFWLAIVIEFKDLERAKARIVVPTVNTIHWGYLNNPYMFSFVAFLDVLFTKGRGAVQQFVPIDRDGLELYFDMRSEKPAIMAGWEAYVRNRGDNRDGYFRGLPRFEHDHDFMPLQAADFLVWWIRKWNEEGKLEDNLRAFESTGVLDFGTFRSARPISGGLMRVNEDQIAKFIKSQMLPFEDDKSFVAGRPLDGVPPPPIYDIRFFLNGKRL